jgi:hypothetical protein
LLRADFCCGKSKAYAPRVVEIDVVRVMTTNNWANSLANSRANNRDDDQDELASSFSQRRSLRFLKPENVQPWHYMVRVVLHNVKTTRVSGWQLFFRGSAVRNARHWPPATQAVLTSHDQYPV